jgi:hypothetical protein
MVGGISTYNSLKALMSFFLQSYLRTIVLLNLMSCKGRVTKFTPKVIIL